MSKVLVITKPDKTVHVMPLKNKTFYESQNHRNAQAAHLQVRIQEMEETEAKKLPMKDDTYFPAGAPTVDSALKDMEIEELKARIAELEKDKGVKTKTK